MGIDPDTHEPSSATNFLPSSPSTRHMAQWESARLEAEARLSKESQPSSGTGTADFFLRLWNSEVGETFRRCGTPSSSSGTGTTSVRMKREEVVAECKSCIDPGSDSCSSNEMEEEDSSESALQLLLDFPTNNDMSFLEQPDFYSSNYF